MSLSCYIPNGASPQGKPNLFLTGHPDDLFTGNSLSPAVLELCGDLFFNQPCAFWYLDGPSDWETLAQQLGRMRLFVVPITGRFLSEPSQAREELIPCALRRRIPILPIALEDGLDEAFGQRYGAMQLLKKAGSSHIMELYQKTLKQFLAQMLAGNALEERVRRAFTSRLFLSYRKKDWTFAHDLILRIQRTACCRSAGIWFDEFLTPGEVFSQEINRELFGCDLFLPSVTPSFVEPDNTSVRKEYAAARVHGKKIIAVEMVPTDHRALEASFPGILDVLITVEDLPKALERVLGAPPAFSPPERYYLMGVSRGVGIDAVPDLEQALALFTRAAEGGWHEAISQLADMYENGNGVDCDLQKALHWRKRLVEIRRDRWDYGVDGLAMADALFALGGTQLGLEDSAAAWNTFLEMEQVLCQLSGDAGVRTRLADCRSSLGNLCRARGDLSGAAAWLRKSLALYQQLFEESARFSTRWNLAFGYNNLAQVYRDSGDLSTARGYALQAQEQARILFQEAGTVDSWRLLFQSSLNLGTICLDQGDTAKAARAYQSPLSALDETPRLACILSTAEDRRGFVSLYNSWGKVVSSREDKIHWFQEAVKFAEPLAQSPGTHQDKRQLAICCCNLATVLPDTDKAVSWLSRALSLISEVYQQTGSNEDLNLAASFSFNMGQFAANQEMLEQALQLWDHLSRTCPEVQQYAVCRDAARNALARLENSSEA